MILKTREPFYIKLVQELSLIEENLHMTNMHPQADHELIWFPHVSPSTNYFIHQ